MNHSRLGSLFLGGTTLVWLTVASAPLVAQNAAVISGRVVSERGDPLGGATVIVTNTNFGGTTAPTAPFDHGLGLSRPGTNRDPDRPVPGVCRRHGRSRSTSARRSRNFTLEPDPLRLDELVDRVFRKPRPPRSWPSRSAR